MNERYVPPGWPARLPPPGEPTFADAALEWLLDRCPADYRGQGVWRRHPVALAWIAARHVDGQVVVMREAYRRARVELADHLPPEAVRGVLDALEEEGLRLRADARATVLVRDALQGATFTPRM